MADHDATFTRHKDYYLQDGVVFLVDNVLFKIPRYMLELNSPFFKTMFTLPTGPREAEGTSDNNPIIIPQVTSPDFEHLLALLYPLTIQYATFTEKWDSAQWQSIFRLATMWDMAQVRSMAIQTLNKTLTAIERVTFGRMYNHPQWIQEGYTILCLRKEYLSAEEARQLDTGDLVKYGKVREIIRARLMKLLDGNLNGPRTRCRDGVTYARNGIYEDGMAYRNDPLVKELIEDHFMADARGCTLSSL